MLPGKVHPEAGLLSPTAQAAAPGATENGPAGGFLGSGFDLKDYDPHVDPYSCFHANPLGYYRLQTKGVKLLLW